MLISVINLSKKPDSEVQAAIRAINRQIREDFTPAWSMSATMHLEGHSTTQPSHRQLVDMRGDAVLYIWDRSDVEDALGYHDRNFRGVPYGVVSTVLADAVKLPWTHTFSHEALELLADPHCNLLVEAPHPAPRHRRTVFRWYEVCDPVQAEWYEIDHVVVSNFVLPLYFTEREEKGGRNAFHPHPTARLDSFGTNPGGYVGYFDPKSGKHETWAARNDALARAVLNAKRAIGGRITRTARRHDRNPHMR